MLEGVLKGVSSAAESPGELVSILGMLEGVLKATTFSMASTQPQVSILGMLEGVLKGKVLISLNISILSFNPWYVGGGVKRSICMPCRCGLAGRFNPWYVGGGVKREGCIITSSYRSSFNPWYVGGGVKR